MRGVNVWLAASCLVCVVLVWSYGLGLEGSEFSGGYITGPLLHAFDAGSLLFVGALALSLFFRRLAAAAVVLASLLCLPMYIYFTAPGPFRRVFRREYSVLAPSNFVWNRWAILGILSILAAIFVAIRAFVFKQPEA